MLRAFDTYRAIGEWRDAWLFEIMETAGGAARDALADLEVHLPEAGAWQVYADQRAFADPRVDLAVRPAFVRLAERFRMQAEPALRGIDPALEAITLTISDADFELLMPAVRPVPALLPVQAPDHAEAAGAEVPKGIFGSAMAIGTKFVFGPSLALVGARVIADAASPFFHGWLREAGTKRLNEAWVGWADEMPTVTSKLVAIIDDAAERARKVVQ